ncbi:hypothetical protein EC991_001637 [Linnemannia zychae]|nr:hypothetical protein EC991_001637 [Linnemannia zychae]
MFPATYTLGNQTHTAATAPTTPLRRETTDEFSKRYTTLFDNGTGNNVSTQSSLDTQVFSHTNMTSLLDPASSISAASWATSTNFTPDSPASPISSCFSSSGHDTETETESAYSSPVSHVIPCKTSADNASINVTLMDFGEDSLEYNSISHSSFEYINNHDIDPLMRIQDLLSDSVANEIAAVAAASIIPTSLLDCSAAVVAFFGQQERHTQQQILHGCNWEEEKETPDHFIQEALDIFDNNNNDDNITKSHNCYGAMNSTSTTTAGGPTRRSSSLSPLVSFAPYPSPSSTVVSCSSLLRTLQHCKTLSTDSNDNDNDAMYQQQSSTDSEPQQANQEQDNYNFKIKYEDDNDDAMSTYSTSSSLSSAPSTRCSSPETADSNSITTHNTSASSTPAPMPIIPSIKGIAAIRQNDGSIMCRNPTTGSVFFLCEICITATPSSIASLNRKQSFGRIHDLRRHQATKHPSNIHGAAKIKVYTCEHCRASFGRRDALLRHYSVKSTRNDGVHPSKEEKELLDACRARAKLI